MKALEDLSTQYDGTVRNSSGGIVQLLYGDDGLDPVDMEGKDGTPFNFNRIILKVKVTFWFEDRHPFEIIQCNPVLVLNCGLVLSVKATCPAPGERVLLPAELLQKLESRLSLPDMSPEGGCSTAFQKSVRDFMEKQVSVVTKTRSRLGLPLDSFDANQTVLEKASANVSGITELQLKVSTSNSAHVANGQQLWRLAVSTKYFYQ